MAPEALMLCPEPPYPLAGGGSLRTASLLNYLAARYTVDLVVFRQPAAPDPRAAIPPGLARRVDVIELPHHSSSVPARAVRNAVRCVRGRPPLPDRFAGFDNDLSAVLRNRAYNLALVEHFWCAPYIDLLERCAGRVVLDLHNIESALHASCAAAGRWPVASVHHRFSRACERMERALLPRFGCILTASDDDAARVRALVPTANAAAYPNAIPCVDLPRAAEENVVAFSGNFEYWPNTGAVRFFARRVWPLLRARHPGLVWRLVGSNAHAVRQYVSRDARIEIVENIPDAVAALAAARVVVVPLLAGSGTRIKILEAWAAGRAVVSTSIGAEGLGARDGEHLVLADSPADLAGAISRLVNDPVERARIGRAGRCLYEQRFTWQHAWRILASQQL